MNFEQASKVLNNVELDRADEAIYIRKEDSFLVVDFDKGILPIEIVFYY